MYQETSISEDEVRNKITALANGLEEDDVATALRFVGPLAKYGDTSMMIVARETDLYIRPSMFRQARITITNGWAKMDISSPTEKRCIVGVNEDSECWPLIAGATV